MLSIPAAPSSATRMHRRWTADAVLLAILLLGLSLRLMYVRTPLLDEHRWRQVDTASVARFFYEERLNPLYPQIAWGGRDGYVESEFPLLPFLTALLYEAFGPRDWLGRLVAASFSVATIAMAYRLGRLLLGRPAGRAMAFLLAVSPGAVFYGRAFMPEAPMLFFSAAAVAGFVEYFQCGAIAALVWGSAALALAGLVKIPAVIVLAPVAAAAWYRHRWRAWKDYPAVIGVSLALLAIAAWYLHAYQLYEKTGLTFGIFGTTKTYPAWISPGPWPGVFPKWSTVADLTSISFYERITVRVFHLHLLPWGFAGAALGMLVWPRNRWPLVPAAWLFAFTAFVLVAGEGNRAHDYYQLPIVLCGGLYFAAAAAPVFDGTVMSRRIVLGRFRPVLLGSVLAGIGLLSFYYSSVILTHYRIGNLDTRAAATGAALGSVTGHRGLAVVVDDYGINSPMLLYFAHMRGWSFDVGDLSPRLIDSLARHYDARYFATTVWPEIAARKPDVVEYLRTRRAIPLANAPAGMAVFDLLASRKDAKAE